MPAAELPSWGAGLARRVGTGARAPVRVLCGPAPEGGGGEGGGRMHQAEAAVEAAAAAAAEAPATASPPRPSSSPLGVPFPKRGPGGQWLAGECGGKESGLDLIFREKGQRTPGKGAPPPRGVERVGRVAGKGRELEILVMLKEINF